ncbi:MAG: phosphotransferase family protein, partial [Steroidobacteraceae bacterium]
MAFAEVTQLCRDGTLINHGPLNDTYRVRAGRIPLFVRHRVLRDVAYGQTFAAEEYLPKSVIHHIRVPRLYRVITDDLGQRTYALFEFVAGRQPDWSGPDILDELAVILARIHAVAGDAFGEICGPFKVENAPDYLYGLLDIELSRLGMSYRKALCFANSSTRLTQLFQAFSSERPCLCHGDVHAGNFLTDA